MESKPLVKSLSFWSLAALVLAYIDPLSGLVVQILPDLVVPYVPVVKDFLVGIAAVAGVGGVYTRKTLISGIVK